ncbi:MAG: hypothetical protein ACD_43C00246G0004 [uncultured bacterium]|nr:MAG: hypothetical protein ACD_43C00246G0004 [uncultured bacterium]
MPLVGAGKDPNSYNSSQLVEFAVFCGENITQTTLVSEVFSDAKGIYSYPGTLATLQQKGLNCNFGCQLYSASSTPTTGTVDWSSATSIASWISGVPSHTIECRKS